MKRQKDTELLNSIFAKCPFTAEDMEVYRMAFNDATGTNSFHVEIYTKSESGRKFKFVIKQTEVKENV